MTAFFFLMNHPCVASTYHVGRLHKMRRIEWNLTRIQVMVGQLVLLPRLDRISPGLVMIFFITTEGIAES